MSKGYSLETVRRVYDDGTGEYIEIGPDTDGLDLLEIRQVCGGQVVGRITGPSEQLRLVAEALLKATETTT